MSRLKQLERLYTSGAISRRQFLARASALGLAAMVSPTLFPNSARATDTPQKGGVLRMGLAHGSTSDSLDPATQSNAFDGTLFLALSNSLVEIGPDGDLLPEIAESWEASPDVKTWTFKIRKGVEFHNGKSLDMKDVVASIHHHTGEESKSGAKAFLTPVTDIKTDGDYIAFELEKPNADFPYVLADIHITIMPAMGDDVDWQSGVGTGAYMLDDFEPGVRAALNKNPNYWKEGRGHFDRIEILALHDIAARTNALKTNQVDIIDRVDLRTVHLLSKIPGIRADEVTSLGHYSIPMLTDNKPFDNNDVRMALKYAIDREALLKTLFRGHGVVANDHPISPANRYFNKDLEQRVYDPDKAKYHLKQAGMDNLSVVLHAAGAAFPEAVDTAVLYKEHAAKAGITIDVKQEPNDGYWSNVWRKKPWCFCYWRGRPTEDWMFSTAYAADAKWNDTNWKHEKFNQILTEARSELDDAKRREMYGEMQRIIKDEGGQVIPIFNNYILVCNDKLKHGPMLRYADLDGYKLPERWWFSS